MKRIEQSFVEGINERLPKDRDIGKRLLKLQNARLFSRGDTAFIKRMEGFIRLWNDQWKLYTNALGNIVVEGKVDTTDYLEGFRVRLSDSILIEEETNLTEPTLLSGRIRLSDNLVIKKIITKPIPSDKVTIKDSFRYKSLRVVRLRDSLVVEESYNIPIIRYVYLQDQITGITDSLTTNKLGFFRLTFADSIGTADSFIFKSRKTIKLQDTVQVVDRDLECLDE